MCLFYRGIVFGPRGYVCCKTDQTEALFLKERIHLVLLRKGGEQFRITA